jgi:putative transposase
LEVGATRRRIANVGYAKVLLHRPVEGIIKTATIRRSRTGRWYVSFCCDCAAPEPLSPTGQHVGIDAALKVFAALSTEEVISNPRFFRGEKQALARARRHLRRDEQDTAARAKQRCVGNRFDLIAVEEVSVTGMTHIHSLAKSIHDAAWSQFVSLLAYKAAGAGRKVVAVNPAYTSQNGSGSGQRQALSLDDCIYTCPHCGLVIDRDLKASKNVLSVGQHALASA